VLAQHQEEFPGKEIAFEGLLENFLAYGFLTSISHEFSPTLKSAEYGLEIDNQVSVMESHPLYNTVQTLVDD
jgi:hypothetical protein